MPRANTNREKVSYHFSDGTVVKVPWSKIEEACAFVEGLTSKADSINTYPMWHGWALREAYLKGWLAGKEASHGA